MRCQGREWHPRFCPGPPPAPTHLPALSRAAYRMLSPQEIRAGLHPGQGLTGHLNSPFSRPVLSRTVQPTPTLPSVPRQCRDTRALCALSPRPQLTVPGHDWRATHRTMTVPFILSHCWQHHPHLCGSQAALHHHKPPAHRTLETVRVGMGRRAKGQSTGVAGHEEGPLPTHSSSGQPG